MGQFIQFLIEKVSLENKLFKELFVSKLCNELGLVFMGRGGGPRLPNLDEIRVKPANPKADKSVLLGQITQFVKQYPTTSGRITNVNLMQNSPHSSKYSSIQFKYGADVFDIVLASGANKGENFEKATYEKLQKWLDCVDHDDVDNMFRTLSAIDPSITLDKLAEVHKAGGSARRPGDLKSSGSVIADIKFTMKDGTERFISLKDRNGDTFANIAEGARGLIDPTTFAVNRSNQLAVMLQEVGFDLKKIQQGYQAFVSKSDVAFDPNQTSNKPILMTSQLGQIIRRGWGVNYIYLREDPASPTGWSAMLINDNTLQSVLLKGLKVEQLRYPHAGAKQIAIIMGNSKFRYKLEIRNSKGGITPTEVKIKFI